MAFDFDEDTAFEGHKDTSPAPKRRGGRKSRADKPEPEPKPEEPRVNVDTAPASAPEAPPAKKPGLPRNGKYPIRPYRPKKWGKGKKWAASGKWVPRFIQAYARTGSIPQSAEVAGVSRGTIHNWRERDPDFKLAMEDAYEWFKGELENEALRRAMVGDEVSVWDKAEQKYVTINQKNPLYFFFYVKRHIPEYRDNYKAEDRDGAQAAIQVLVNVLEQGKRMGVSDATGKAPALPSFDDFPVIDVTPPETKEEERARLLARLSELDSGETHGDDATAGDQ